MCIEIAGPLAATKLLSDATVDNISIERIKEYSELWKRAQGGVRGQAARCGWVNCAASTAFVDEARLTQHLKIHSHTNKRAENRPESLLAYCQFAARRVCVGREGAHQLFGCDSVASRIRFTNGRRECERAETQGEAMEAVDLHDLVYRCKECAALGPIVDVQHHSVIVPGIIVPEPSSLPRGMGEWNLPHKSDSELMIRTEKGTAITLQMVAAAPHLPRATWNAAPPVRRRFFRNYATIIDAVSRGVQGAVLWSYVFTHIFFTASKERVKNKLLNLDLLHRPQASGRCQTGGHQPHLGR